MQLLVIQYTMKMLHIGFMQVLTLVVEISTFKVFKILNFSTVVLGWHARTHKHTHVCVCVCIYIYIYVDASVVCVPPPHRVTS